MPGLDYQWHLGQAFPLLPIQNYWSPDVCHAHEILQHAYQHATGLLQQEDSDQLHTWIHADQIRQMVPLFGALHHEVGDIDWTTTCASILGKLLYLLENLVLSASEQYAIFFTFMHSIIMSHCSTGIQQ